MKKAGQSFFGVVRHECYLSGKDKDGLHVEDGVIGIPDADVLPGVRFPGMLGDSAEVHDVLYIAKVEHEDDDSLISAHCNYQASTSI